MSFPFSGRGGNLHQVNITFTNKKVALSKMTPIDSDQETVHQSTHYLIKFYAPLLDCERDKRFEGVYLHTTCTRKMNIH